MIFDRANMDLIRIVKRALDDFVGLLRLVTNPKKNHIFLSGVDDELQISL